ncbi:hypothetical protein [Methylobacterium sp. WL9]|uniref:hypothetical protein n=1 Tax=Methylobacterium sp. WL9 TaxID=2603898 RepID=UPI0011C78B61|nr:hypothetical protein [Methylobacterium sp. WL9]TXN21823.1 hypothetical protein FV217_13060 [Methylobacterium sp. WL9]
MVEHEAYADRYLCSLNGDQRGLMIGLDCKRRRKADFSITVSAQGRLRQIATPIETVSIPPRGLTASDLISMARAARDRPEEGEKSK